MTERFKELYINEDGEVGLTNDGLMMVGTIKDLENLLNTLDEKSKGLYCYMVSFYEYSDSEFRPIFHEKKYTKEEFQKICNEIKAKIRKDQENVWSWQYPDRFIEYAKRYGFKEVKILEVDTIDFKVSNYLEYEMGD